MPKYVVQKFFQGKHFASIENIDQDRLIDLVFGEMLPKMKSDRRFSFTVGSL